MTARMPAEDIRQGRALSTPGGDEAARRAGVTVTRPAGFAAAE